MVEEAVKRVQERLAEAAKSSGRHPDDILLVAATKSVPVAFIQQALQAGVKAIGENRIQEAKQKLISKEAVPAQWHFIGHLQSNKAKDAVKLFDMIQSLDSLSLAKAVQESALKLEKIQPCLIEVKVSQETAKFGVPVEELPEFLEELSRFRQIQIEGLMAMAPRVERPEDSRPFFRKAHECFQKMKPLKFPNVVMRHLSMGMSRDYLYAVEEGATMVRIGTALFGERPAAMTA